MRDGGAGWGRRGWKRRGLARGRFAARPRTGGGLRSSQGRRTGSGITEPGWVLVAARWERGKGRWCRDRTGKPRGRCVCAWLAWVPVPVGAAHVGTDARHVIACLAVMLEDRRGCRCRRFDQRREDRHRRARRRGVPVRPIQRSSPVGRHEGNDQCTCVPYDPDRRAATAEATGPGSPKARPGTAEANLLGRVRQLR